MLLKEKTDKGTRTKRPDFLIRTHGRQKRRTAPLLALMALFGLLSGLTACGKKAPPFIPRAAFTVKVTGLQAEYQPGFILLKGTLEGLNNNLAEQPPVSGCRVYYTQYPLSSPPCANCPIEFQNYQRFGAEGVTAEGFFCRIPEIQKEQIYFFKVLLIGPDGQMGPASERIRIETP